MRLHRRVVALAVFASVGAMGLAACGSNSASETALSSAPASESVAATELAGSAAASPSEAGSSGAGEPFKIGYVQWAPAPDQDAMAAGIKEGAAQYGYDVTVSNAQGDAANANNLMRTFATQPVDAIIIDSFSSANLASGLDAAKDAGIPVYNMYSPDADPVPGIAVSMQANAGEESAQAIIDKQGPKGDVLAFTLPAGANCGLSERKFDEVMAANPGWNVQKQAVPAPGWAKTAETTTKAWLLSHPEGTPLAIWGCWDGPNIGAAAALKAADRWDVQLYGQNTTAATVALLQDGHYAASYFFDTNALAKKMVDLVQERQGTAYADISPVVDSFESVEVTPDNVNEITQQFPALLKS